MGKNIKDIKKSLRTRKRTKDLDEIHRHMEPDRINAYLHQTLDPDLPGDGQFYCVPCARYFINQACFTDHKKTKNHKKRMRLLKDTPYTQAEAEAAAGMGSYTVKIKKTETVGEDKMVDDDEDCSVPLLQQQQQQQQQQQDVSIPLLVNSVDDIIDKMNLT